MFLLHSTHKSPEKQKNYIILINLYNPPSSLNNHFPFLSNISPKLFLFIANTDKRVATYLLLHRQFFNTPLRTSAKSHFSWV